LSFILAEIVWKYSSTKEPIMVRGNNTRGGNSLNENARPTLSIVIPAYNEENNLLPIYREIISHLDGIKYPFEIIFVDDGSSDNTWNTIMSLHNTDSRVKGIQFSRNFGHQYALYAGLKCANGEAVVCMDADLQHPPEVIPNLIAEWEKGFKIVHTVRLDTENLSIFKKLTSKLYYKIFSLLTGVKIESGMADFRLLDRQALDSVLQFSEEGLFLRGIVQWIGYPSSCVTFQCRERFSGNSKYNLRRMLRFALSGVTSFSIIPLRIGILLGIITSLFSFYLIVTTIYSHYQGLTVPGWTTTVTVMSLMFGILFILLGLVGEYIGRILIEVRGRPRYLMNNSIGVRIQETIKKRSLNNETIDRKYQKS
jgi:polyisoprenyl-phosphate glycosyltransferase